MANQVYFNQGASNYCDLDSESAGTSSNLQTQQVNTVLVASANTSTGDISFDTTYLGESQDNQQTSSGRGRGRGRGKGSMIGRRPQKPKRSRPVADEEDNNNEEEVIPEKRKSNERLQQQQQPVVVENQRQEGEEEEEDEVQFLSTTEEKKRHPLLDMPLMEKMEVTGAVFRSAYDEIGKLYQALQLQCIDTVELRKENKSLREENERLTQRVQEVEKEIRALRAGSRSERIDVTSTASPPSEGYAEVMAHALGRTGCRAIVKQEASVNNAYPSIMETPKSYPKK